MKRASGYLYTLIIFCACKPIFAANSSTNQVAAAQSEAKPAAPADKLRPVPEELKLTPVEPAQRESGALDLQDCFRLAAVRSDNLQITQQDVEAARSRLYQSIAQIFPTINLVNTQNFRPSSGGGGFISAGGTVVGSGARNGYGSTTELTLSQPIFNGFANYNNVGAASAELAAKKYNLERGYQTLYANVAQAFYQILINERDLIILNDSVRVLEARVKELEDWVRIGRSRPSELVQARAELAGTRVTIEQTKGLAAAARELMAFYIGVPSNQFKLYDAQKFPTAEALEGYLSNVGARPDILALVQEERREQRLLSASKGALLPTVTANGSYELTSDPPNNNSWQVQLQIELPLFDGGLILSRIREQKALTAQSELNLQNLQRSADQDVRTAFANFNSSAAEVVRLREQVELTHQNYQAQLADYRHGVVSNLDVLTALSTLQDARRQLNSADLNARLNLINLHVAAGLAARSLPSSGSTTTLTGTDKPKS